MTIRGYIRDQVFARRAREHGCVVIYDPVRRYREVAASMNTPTCRVVDVSSSLIEARELASASLGDLASGAVHQLVVWVPADRPTDDEARQKDPFSVFAHIGAAFPSGDGDEYAEICRKAKPDHASDVNRLFQEGEPTFDMIDALEEGGSWPKLKTLLGVSSPKEILLALLSPSPRQSDALKQDAFVVNGGSRVHPAQSEAQGEDERADPEVARG